MTACYELAKYYRCPPDEFLILPPDEVAQHYIETIKLIEKSGKT